MYRERKALLLVAIISLLISIVMEIIFVTVENPVETVSIIAEQKSIPTIGKAYFVDETLICGVDPVFVQAKEVPVIKKKKKVKKTVVTSKPETVLSKDDISLIALVTMAEAEGESEYGQRLVIDTILNRLDHADYPDTVHGVIYQKSQFSSMWNGRVDRCTATKELKMLVREELKSRTNNDTIYFTAGKYGKYGKHMFQEGNHYFCSY